MDTRSDVAVAQAKSRPTGNAVGRVLLQEIPLERPKSRLTDIDAARGVAIVLVVIGHIVARGEWPTGNNWYIVLMKMIYQFHMPLFMVLSGITFALSVPRFASWADVGRFSLRRVKPLLVPFIGIGILVLIGKAVTARFMHVDNPPGMLRSDFITLLIYPTESVARFLWFVYVLSIYLILVPVFFRIFGRRPVVLLLIAIALQFNEWPDLFAIERVVEYMPFFVGGMVLWIYRTAWSPVPAVVFWATTIVFAALLAFSVGHPVPRWITGVFSVPVVIGLAQRLTPTLQSFWAYLGQNSLSIYLFNGIAMGLAKGLLLKLLPWDGTNFLLYFPVLLMAGVSLPMVIKHMATRWLPPIAKYV